MFKKFFTYPVFLVLFLSFIGSLLFGYSIKYYAEGGKKYLYLRDIVFFIAETPKPIINMIRSKSLNPNKPPLLTKHKDKKRFEKFIENKRNALLVLPRYDHILSRSVVDIVDLNNFQTIHTYKHDIEEMNNQIVNVEEYLRFKNNISPIRFRYFHPLLFSDGTLINSDNNSYAFKIDFCSNMIWINDKEVFHHSKMLDHEGNIWITGKMYPYSKLINKYATKDNRKFFENDSLIKIDINGKIIFNKSVTEILIRNNILPNNFVLNSLLSKQFDPIHLNDIEPALDNTKYWKKGDVFISLREQSSIVHYRPSNDEVINYITGPFVEQHDVDIISDKEISILNNNNFFINNEHSEVVVYNFETKKFRKLFNNQLQKENFKTYRGGLHKILKDGSLMVDEQAHGRIILFNNRGEKEWEFVNKDKNGDIANIWWSRIIEDEIFIEQFKSLLQNKKCLN